MELVALDTKEYLQRQIEWHVAKILLMQDLEGMIPSYIEFLGNQTQKKKDLPRQAMTTMALSFAQKLHSPLDIQPKIDLSRRYLFDTIEPETDISKLYTYLYLALGQQYAGSDPTEYCGKIQALLLPEALQHPIAINLYLRLSSLLPNPLLHAVYLIETQRYNLSLIPRPGRFFDYADTLVWAKSQDSLLALKEYRYLLTHRTSENWFEDTYTKIPATSSVVGKIFEVFAYYNEDVNLLEHIYSNLMGRPAASQYAKDAFGRYAKHILSEPNTLRVDDVHTHILVGLCYRLQQLLLLQKS
jgi:hypothetical protein